MWLFFSAHRMIASQSASSSWRGAARRAQLLEHRGGALAADAHAVHDCADRRAAPHLVCAARRIAAASGAPAALLAVGAVWAVHAGAREFASSPVCSVGQLARCGGQVRRCSPCDARTHQARQARVRKRVACTGMQRAEAACASARPANERANDALRCKRAHMCSTAQHDAARIATPRTHRRCRGWRT